MLASVSGALTSLVGDHALYAVFGLMAVDAVLPAFSELVMLYAGVVAAGVFAGQDVVLFGGRISHGLAAYLALALAGTLGYTLGSLAGWGIGAGGGRPLLERHGGLLHLPPERLARAERWFERWGDWAVLVGRLTPVIRSFISIPAGVFGRSLGRYTGLTLIGSALWCFALAGAGWALGRSYERFHQDFRYVEVAVTLALVALVAYVVVRARRSSKRSLARQDAPRAPS